MRKCRHKTTHLLWWRDGRMVNWVVEVRGEAEWWGFAARICNDCGAWLPIGESRDTPETEIEVRAAELVFRQPGSYVAGETWAGWEHAARGWEPPPTDDPDFWVGYLARIIASHGEQGGER